MDGCTSITWLSQQTDCHVTDFKRRQSSAGRCIGGAQSGAAEGEQAAREGGLKVGGKRHNMAICYRVSDGGGAIARTGLG